MAYIRYKTGYYVKKVNELMGTALEIDDIIEHIGVNLKRLNNIRFITREIEQYIASIVEEQ